MVRVLPSEAGDPWYAGDALLKVMTPRRMPDARNGGIWREGRVLDGR